MAQVKILEQMIADNACPVEINSQWYEIYYYSDRPVMTITDDKFHQDFCISQGTILALGGSCWNFSAAIWAEIGELIGMPGLEEKVSQYIANAQKYVRAT